MVESLKLRNGKHTPAAYCGEFFRSGKTFSFTPGVNVIVGPNGSGKTTILHLLESYLLCRENTRSTAAEQNELYAVLGNRFLDGADVAADYRCKAFRMREPNELREGENGLRDMNSFRNLFDSYHQSRGQNGLMGIEALLDELFHCKDYRFPEVTGELAKYIERNRIQKNGVVTIFMDEPDNNLDIDNIADLKAMLTTQRDDIQIICVLHNPALIYALEKSGKVNFVETERGYLKKVRELIESI